MAISSRNNVKCVQLNLCRSKSSTTQLINFMEKNNIFIAFITEPYIICNKICGIPFSYEVLNNNQMQDKTPKSAIIFKKSVFNLIIINTFSNNCLTFSYITFANIKVLAISAYFPPLYDITEQLNHIQNAIQTLKPNFYIISVDSNAHSNVWFDRRNDRRGHILSEFISKHRLIILNNNKNSPTFEINDRKSSIDLTLISESLANYVHFWTLLEIDSQSDHKFITFEFVDNPPVLLYKSTLKYNTKLSDWSQFLSAIKDKLHELKQNFNLVNDCQNLEAIVSEFTEILCNNCEKFMKKIDYKRHKKSNNWWTRELTILRRNVCKARRRYQRCQTYERSQHRSVYRALDIKYKKLIEKTKIESWLQFIRESSDDNPWSLAYKIAKNKIFQQKLTELVDSSGIPIIDEKTISNILFEKLFPMDDISNEQQIHKQMRVEALLDSTGRNDEPFTINEVNNVVKGQNPKKAPGVDGLTADIISKVHSIDNTFLLQVYNKCLELSYFPYIWRKSIIKIVPKHNKSDYREPNSYRPISLLPIHGKILEKLLINRIQYYLNTNSLLHCNQYGFSPQKSTEMALKSILDFIENAFNRKGFALVLSLDINGAFNTCFWSKIINTLRIKECPNNLLSLVKSYFSDRESSIWYMNCETTRKMNIGCPQGSACGPGFWNICIDDIFELNEGNDCIIEAFADDIILKIFSTSIESLEEIANRKLNQLNEWSIANKLQFNILKTNCALFTKKIKYKSPEIYFDGQKLKLVKHFKHLGIVIDTKLTFRMHSNYVKSKVIQFTNILLRFAKSNYGLDSRALHTIYTGAILPTIGYGISVWVEKIDKKYMIKIFQQIQRLIAIRLTKSYKTVSNNALNIIANFIPIDLWLKERAVLYFTKNNISHQLINDYFRGEIIDLNDIQRRQNHYQLLPHHLRAPVQTTDRSEGDYVIKIDSCVGPSGVGAVYAIKRNDIIIIKKYKISRRCSTFQALLWVLNKAIETLYINNWSNGSVVIYSKSRAVISALADQNSTNKLVCDIFKNICELKQKQMLFNIYNNTSNEDMSEIIEKAKEASNSHQAFAFDLIPLNYIKNILRQNTLEKWNERWVRAEDSAQTKMFFQTVFERKNAENYFRNDFYLTQALTSHGKLGSYLKRFKLQNNDYCNYCGQDGDDANHRLYYCEYFVTERHEFIEFVESKGHVWPTEQRILIRREIFTQFLNFCKIIFN